MSTISTENKKINSHKLLMWIGIASICMMFAGWTSAFLVRKAQGNWLLFSMPTSFWISTLVILISSVTMYFSIKEFKKNNITKFKLLFNATTLLGIAFMVLQFMGFKEMQKAGLNLASSSEGISGSFIYVISSVHILHMLGGVIAMIIMNFVIKFRIKKNNLSSNGLEILGTYWHFVDVLWIYLFLFFLINQK
jgi:cytochrome c oxidase subunit 3